MEKNPKDELLAYFMGQTNERLLAIEKNMVQLIAFKAEVQASARSAAFLVSLVVGLIMLLLNVIAKKYGLV